jgi:hypothetical protein
MISSLKIDKMALSNQIDFLAFLRLRKMTYRNFINGIRQLFLTPLPHEMALCHGV